MVVMYIWIYGPYYDIFDYFISGDEVAAHYSKKLMLK